MARSGPEGFRFRSCPFVFVVWPGETLVFWFLLLAMVVVVAAVTLAVVGGGDEGSLPEAGPDFLVDPLPLTRPVGRADIEELRLPLAARGYRMADVDDVLGRVGAELAERDSRIAELEAALAGAQATSVGGPDLFTKPAAAPEPAPAFAPEEALPPAPVPDSGATEAPRHPDGTSHDTAHDTSHEEPKP